MKTNKSIGYQNEELVMKYYLSHGCKLIAKNYTIQGGEIDLIIQDGKELVIIEVKTVNTIDELDNYITDKKIKYLQRTLETFLQNFDNNSIDGIRMDVAFVKDDKILDIFENITGE